jgi:hypothetical protein
MNRIAHFHSLSSAETIKQIAESKKEGRQEIFTCFTWLKNSMLLICRRSNRKFFLRPLAAPSYLPGALGVRPPVPAPVAAKGQVPFTATSSRQTRDVSSLSDSQFHCSDFLETSCLELVEDLFRVCRRRLEQVADKLETSRV